MVPGWIAMQELDAIGVPFHVVDEAFEQVVLVAAGIQAPVFFGQLEAELLDPLLGFEDQGLGLFVLGLELFELGLAGAQFSFPGDLFGLQAGDLVR